jgi:hypothetical protein
MASNGKVPISNLMKASPAILDLLHAYRRTSPEANFKARTIIARPPVHEFQRTGHHAYAT